MISSPYATYSDTTAQKRVITDYITLLDPADAPFVEAIGGLDGAASKFQFVNQGIKVEWLEDTLTLLASTLSAALSATNDVLLTPTDTGALQPGHILLCGTEKLWVSAVSNAGVATVTRGFGGSTAATHTATTAFTIIGMARLEGDDSDPIGFTDITSNYNYTQIFQKEIKITGSEMYQDTFGMSDPYQYQSSKSIPEMMRLVERSIQYGVRSGDAGSTSTPRAMGGYQTFITTNLASGQTISVAKIEDCLELAYNAGGSGEYLAIISPSMYQAVKNLYDTSAFVRYAPEQTRFGMMVDTIVTPFGNVSFVMDRWQISSLIPMMKTENVGMLTYRPWEVEDLAKTGDSRRSQLIGEFTLCVKLDKSHAMLTSCSAS